MGGRRTYMKVFLASVGRLESDIRSTANQAESGGIMKVYLAESGGVMKAYLAESGGRLFGDANILQSFYYADEYTENTIIPKSKNFMLDSGAFTFMQSAKKQINWNEYAEKCAQFVKKNRIEKYFEEAYFVLSFS